MSNDPQVCPECRRRQAVGAHREWAVRLLSRQEEYRLTARRVLEGEA